jgi:hypothetical protein
MMCAVTWFSVIPAGTSSFPSARRCRSRRQPKAFLLVDVLDGARLHHRRHAVDQSIFASLNAAIMLM